MRKRTGLAEKGKAWRIATYVLLLFMIVIAVFPAIWMLSTAIKSPVELYDMPPEIIPDEPTLGNFVSVYTIEMASYFAMAEPQEWAGFAAPYAPGVDAQSVLTLRYPNDVLATLRMGITCDAPCMMTIMGDKGRIELPRFYLGNDAILYENGTQTEHLHDSFELPKGFIWQIEAVRDALLAGQTTSDIVPPETTITCAAIMEDMMHRFFPEENA